MGKSEKSPPRVFAADFETTVFDGQEYTEVWASGIAELYHDECVLFHTIEDTWDAILDAGQEDDLRIYYHNLKFDGHFWLDFLYRHGYSNALEVSYDESGTVPTGAAWKKWGDVKYNEMVVGISDSGQWYYIKIKILGGHTVEFRDSLKLIPMPLRKAAKDFNTPHQKLDMEYEGERYAGCEITPEEQRYIENDVLALKECLEIIYARGHDKLTIGACCMAEFRKLYGPNEFLADFPDLTQYATPAGEADLYGALDADEYVRKAYRGGWCYCHPRTRAHNVRHDPGITADVNSLYPSMMHSESGNAYPFGKPYFFRGKIDPRIEHDPRFYYFLRVRMRFRLKPDKLPFIQIKNTWRFTGTEYLTSSEGRDGKDQILEFTFTCTDWALVLEHYEVYDLEYLDGVFFWAKRGIFDAYIDIYKKQKIEATNKADRTIAKLFQNNLYGKFAANTDSSFKVPDIYSLGDVLDFEWFEEHKKKPGYIAIGAAITSYARNFTIRAAQANYSVFAYSDTDSIHLYTDEEHVKGITIHDKNYCCWKIESHWDRGWFVRQKTYCERYPDGEGKPSKWHVTCAGLPDLGKKLFLESIGQAEFTAKELARLDDDEKAYIREGVRQCRSIEDFKIGLRVPGKLVPKVIHGGVILQKVLFTMN